MTTAADRDGKQDIVGNETELQPVENRVFAWMQRKNGQNAK